MILITNFQEFESWKNNLSEEDEATSFFTVIKRHSEGSSSLDHTTSNKSHLAGYGDLYAVPYSAEYKAFLTNASDLLHKAGDLASLPRYSICCSFLTLVSLFQ